MDTSGSDSTTGSADISATNSSCGGLPSAHISTNHRQNVTSTNLNTVPIGDDNDSASDVSMSAETDDEDDEAPNMATIQVNPDVHTLGQPDTPVEMEQSGSAPSKRKYIESIETTASGHISNGTSQESRKRLKPDAMNEKDEIPEICRRQNKSLLPAEIWHHIFTFIPPRTLGLLLRVNRSFNAYLDPSSSDDSMTPLSQSAVPILKPDHIWRASRRLFRPGMPGPLQGKSELDMWKLACAISCRFCGKKQSNQTVWSDKWHPGPGESGVVPIWPLGVPACGPCIQSRSLKVA